MPCPLTDRDFKWFKFRPFKIDPLKYKNLKEVDSVIGNTEKLETLTWKNIDQSKNLKVGNILEESKTVPNSIEKFEGKSRAYIEIQQGCNHRCTFCIIPFGRGNNRSVPAGEIVNKIKKIVSNGYNEVVLTGVDITAVSYTHLTLPTKRIV